MREFVACDLCGADDGEVVYRHHSARIQNRVCRRCGLAYLSPRPSERDQRAFYERYEQAYPSEYLTRPGNPFEVAAAERADFAAAWVSGKKRVLEFGSGYGHFVAAMEKRGHRVSGLEASELQVEVARGTGLAALKQGCIESVDSEAPFDLICSFHVLEHLRSPLAALRRAAQNLRDDGLLLLDVPDATRLPATAIEHFYIASGQHLYAFTPAILAALLRQAGFSLLHLAHQPMGLMHPSNLRAVARKASGAERFYTGVASNQVCEAMSTMRSHHRRLESLGRRVEERLRSWQRASLRAALYGGGFHTLGLLDLCPSGSARIACVIDDDPGKWTTSVAGVPVRGPQAFCDGSVDAVLVSSLASEREMAARARAKNPGLEVATVYGEQPLPVARKRLYFSERRSSAAS